MYYPEPSDKERFQKMNAAIQPDDWLIARTKSAMQDKAAPKRRRAVIIGTAAAALTACAAVAAGLLLPLPGRGTAVPIPGPESAGPAVQESEPLSPVEHAVTVKVRLSESAPAQALEAGVAFRWGSYRMERGELGEYDDGSGPVKRYSLHLTGNGSLLTIEGDNIARVRVTTQKGSLIYDTEKYQALRSEKERDTVLCTFTMPAANLETDENGRLKVDFVQQWKDGAYGDGYQKLLEEGYPSNDWFMLQQAGEANGQVTMNVLAKRPPNGQDFEVDYTREGKLVYLQWQAPFALQQEVAQYPAVPYEQIEGDTVTLRITFTDGSTQDVVLDLSLDAQGYLVGCMR